MSYDQENFKGAGVLLVCMVSGTPSVILIYSKEKQAWEEPGGGYEKHLPICNTAYKELFEETAKLINIPATTIRQYPYIDTITKKKQLVYRLFIVNVTFSHSFQKRNVVDALRRKFHSNLVCLLQNPETPGEYLESTDISFVPLKLFNNIQPVVPKRVCANKLVPSGEKKRFYIELPCGKKTIITKRLKKIMKHEKFSDALVMSFTKTKPIEIY